MVTVSVGLTLHVNMYVHKFKLSSLFKGFCGILRLEDNKKEFKSFLQFVGCHGETYNLDHLATL